MRSRSIVPFFAALCAIGCGARVSEHTATETAARPDDAVSQLARAAPAVRPSAAADGTISSVEIVGLAPTELQAFERLDKAQRATVLAVFVVDATTSHLPAVSGASSVAGDVLRFVPRFALKPGLRYRALLRRGLLAADANAKTADLLLEFATAAPPLTPPAEVTGIDPTSDRLPENLLRFYIHFSAPMSRGEAYRHIHLRDADGRDVEAAFLELGEELWDPAMRRFTLLCDPGRVKRGLRPREELGPVLEEGKTYALVIDREWPDAQGRILARPIEKTFHVLAADEVPIDPMSWQIESPRAGSRDALVVRFGEPLDRSLVERLVWVEHDAGEKVAGAIDVGDDESSWQFVPDRPWPSGQCRLVVDTALEDVAGNAVGRAFDVDTFGPIQQKIESKVVAIPFTVIPWSAD
jgi:hypothetical protein